MSEITVRAGSLAEANCDFCQARQPIWAYPCPNFDLPEWEWGSVGPWLVCNLCSFLVDNQQVMGLVLRRIHQGPPSGLTVAQEEVWVKLMISTFMAFFRLRNGPRHAATEADLGAGAAAQAASG